MTSKRRLIRDAKSDSTQLDEIEHSNKRKKINSEEKSCRSEKNNEKLSKQERRLYKAQRKEEKAKLLETIPKVDSNGIAFTKIQLRRMLRRVKNGLDPVPTEEETKEMTLQIKRDKQMEEAELAGMIYDRKPSENSERENEEEEDNDEEHDEKQQLDEDENHIEGKVDSERDECVDSDKRQSQEDSKKSSLQKVRSKPVPPNYVCQACQNKHSPAHWIYNCPDKIHRPGCNKVSKNDRGIHAPSARKLFVSGLPFDWKHKDVVEIFRNECGVTVEHCKLLMFEDTKRCKGQAFVTFDSEESATKGLTLHGKALKTSNKKSNQDGNNTKELTLAITKVQNRRK